MMQYYEFKQTINYFKTFEGWGGFIMALPGCFSMYRYEAIKGEPLQQFFKLINMEAEPSCWEANEYLVEDRLLSNNTYYQKGKGYRCDFITGASCITDAPHTLELLMKQRRRWSNGFLFGELTTLMNTHNVFGFNGQTHSINQRLKMLIYMPILLVNKLMGWIAPAIMLTQMKYMFIYTAMAFFDNADFKRDHYDAWKFFTNDPSSMGFASYVNLTICFLLLSGVLSSIGAQISDVMGFFRLILIFFQTYTLFCQIGTYKMIKNFGFYDSEGNFNIFVLQFVLTWVVLLCPFYIRPFDFMKNAYKYIVSLPCYYLSYLWWYILITIYSMCNLDDVTWGNRPANASKGLNTFIDDAKRQEILRQSYRRTRTEILIWWLFGNICLMFLFDTLILAAVHGDIDIKSKCQAILKGYAWYTCANSVIIIGLSAFHHLVGSFKLLMCKSYIPATIFKRPPVANDAETKVLLDDTEEEIENTHNQMPLKKKAGGKKAGRSEFDTIEDMSFYSDDLESHQLVQQYKKGGWTY